jgi:hypothetical protein
MKVTILEQRKVSGIDVSTAVTIETERNELSKAEIIAMVRILLEDDSTEVGE